MLKVYVEAYGCSSNIADKETICGILLKKNYYLTEDPKRSDANILLTCAVKVPTVNRMLHRIKKLTEIKKPLIVAGCLTKVRKADIERINPNASLVSSDWIDKIDFALQTTLAGEKVELLEDSNRYKTCLPKCRSNPAISIIQIGKGCLSNCAYCSEPYKGKLFSYPPEEILKEAEIAIREGCKEIWLSSLDNGCYGFDIGTNLAKLLNSISNIESKFFIRLGMANPLHVGKILDELVESYKSEKIFKFLHIPIQSASDRVLASMRRCYNTKLFEKIVKRYRKEIPHLTLSTDIIVGFPSETELSFRKTLEFIKKIKPDVVNISKFGLHPNTLATSMRQVDQKTINKRSKKLFAVVRKVQLSNNKKWIGWEGETLIDERGKNGTWIGRNFAYKPIVIKSRGNMLGRFVKVRVEKAVSNYLLGGLILNKSFNKL